MIFDATARDNWEIKTYSDSFFSFLNKSAWPISSFARQFINYWTTQMQADREFISKLTSKNDNHFNGSILEMLFYSICRGYGININKALLHKLNVLPILKFKLKMNLRF